MRGSRPQRGEDKERGSARERTLGRGETRAQARTSLSLWFFPSHLRPAPSEIKHLNTRYRTRNKNKTSLHQAEEIFGQRIRTINLKSALAKWMSALPTASPQSPAPVNSVNRVTPSLLSNMSNPSLSGNVGLLINTSNISNPDRPSKPSKLSKPDNLSNSNNPGLLGKPLTFSPDYGTIKPRSQRRHGTCKPYASLTRKAASAKQRPA